MKLTEDVYCIYTPAGFQGFILRKDVKSYAASVPQAVFVRPGDEPPKWAKESEKARQRRERLRTDPSLPEILMGVIVFVMVAVSLAVLWGIFR